MSHPPRARLSELCDSWELDGPTLGHALGKVVLQLKPGSATGYKGVNKVKKNTYQARRTVGGKVQHVWTSNSPHVQGPKCKGSATRAIATKADGREGDARRPFSVTITVRSTGFRPPNDLCHSLGGEGVGGLRCPPHTEQFPAALTTHGDRMLWDIDTIMVR